MSDLTRAREDAERAARQRASEFRAIYLQRIIHAVKDEKFYDLEDACDLAEDQLANLFLESGALSAARDDERDRIVMWLVRRKGEWTFPQAADAIANNHHREPKP